jgi:outer membrane protein assembly factor BamB
MRRKTSQIVVLTLSLGAVHGPGYGQAREIYPTTPDEVILKRAAEQPRPLWRVPLGPALIEDMQLAGPDRLLVSLRKDFPGLPNLDTILVDTAKGQVLWRYSRDKVKGQYDCLLILQDLILFRVDRGESASLLALDPQTGAEKWSVVFKGVGVVFIPFIPGGAALAINQRAASVDLTALDLENGQTAWQRSFPVAKGARFAAPRTIDDDILVFYNGLERLSAKDGRTVMSRRDLVFDPAGPPPQTEDGVLWAVDSHARLSALDVASGKDMWTATLAGDVDWTNIYPLGEKIYLRGVDGSGAHRLICFPRGGGQPLWTYSGTEPSISNLVGGGGILYFGTPTSLVALNAADGKPLFSAVVTTTGRAFPVRLRKTDGRIVYIGELVVAAFDARTGQCAYRQGMTPGSSELHLNGLDAATPNLKDELKAASSLNTGARAASSVASMEMARYQNLSATNGAQARRSWDKGDTLDY